MHGLAQLAPRHNDAGAVEKSQRERPDRARAFVADNVGLRVVDVSEPTHPTLVGFYDTPGEAYGITVFGNSAYVADAGGGLQAVDVSDLHPTSR